MAIRQELEKKDKKTCLHDKHVSLGATMVSFGGFDMPLLYQNAGIAPEHAIRVISLFDDPQQVLEDSKEYLDRYYDREFGSEDEPQGASDLPENQIVNSPLIDGMSKENPKEETVTTIEKKEVKNEEG